MFQNASQKIRKGSVRQKLISMTLRRKTKLGDDMVINSKQPDDTSSESYNALLDNRPTSNLDKLHFIIGHGILRSDLRYSLYALSFLCSFYSEMKSIVKSANNSRQIHQRIRMHVDGYYYRYV